MAGVTVGTTVKVKIASAFLVGEVSASANLTSGIIDVSSKASGRVTNKEYGRYAETMTISSLASTDSTLTTTNFEDLMAAAIAGTKLAVEITDLGSGGVTPVAGSHKKTGNVLVSDVTWDVPDNDRMTFSATLHFDGATTNTPVAGS